MLPKIVLRQVSAGCRAVVCRSTSGHKRLVKTPSVLHGTEAAQGVGQYDGAGLEVALGAGGGLVPAKRSGTVSLRTETQHQSPDELVETLARRSEREARHAPIEQRDFHLVLEFTHVTRDIPRGDTKGLCRSGDASHPRYLMERSQLVETVLPGVDALGSNCVPDGTWSVGVVRTFLCQGLKQLANRAEDLAVIADHWPVPAWHEDSLEHRGAWL